LANQVSATLKRYSASGLVGAFLNRTGEQSYVIVPDFVTKVTQLNVDYAIGRIRQQSDIIAG
jgi:hypothetical protein